APVQRVGDGERPQVDDDERVDVGPVLVVRGDAVEVRLDERVAGERVGAHRGVHVGDGGLLDAEARALGGGGARSEDDEERDERSGAHSAGRSRGGPRWNGTAFVARRCYDGRGGGAPLDTRYARSTSRVDPTPPSRT